MHDYCLLVLPSCHHQIAFVRRDNSKTRYLRDYDLSQSYERTDNNFIVNDLLHISIISCTRLVHCSIIRMIRWPLISKCFNWIALISQSSIIDLCLSFFFFSYVFLKWIILPFQWMILNYDHHHPNCDLTRQLITSAYCYQFTFLSLAYSMKEGYDLEFYWYDGENKTIICTLGIMPPTFQQDQTRMSWTTVLDISIAILIAWYKRLTSEQWKWKIDIAMMLLNCLRHRNIRTTHWSRTISCTRLWLASSIDFM
jgi:hypothetical protein